MVEITQFEKLIPPDVCEYVISYFCHVANEDGHKIDIWLPNRTFIYKIFEDQNFNDPKIQNIINIVNDKVLEIINDYFIECNHAEIVFWDETTFMDQHRDPGRIQTAILYLNDNYHGGETVFETGEIVKPETGKLVLFDGSKIDHGVNLVSQGQRYTMIFWFYPDDLLEK